MNKLGEHLENIPLEQRLYLLNHISQHLYAAKRFNNLFSLARQEIFLAAQADTLPESPQLPLETIQNALKGAIEADESEIMAEFVLSHSSYIRDMSSKKTPLDASKSGELENAWKLADIGSIEESTPWYLLIIWQQKDAGNLIGAKATLDRLLKKELDVLPGWYHMYGTELLLPVLDIDKKAFLDLNKRILEDSNGRRVLVESLANIGQIALAMEIADKINPFGIKRLAHFSIGVALSHNGNHAESKKIFYRILKQILKEAKKDEKKAKKEKEKKKREMEKTRKDLKDMGIDVFEDISSKGNGFMSYSSSNSDLLELVLSMVKADFYEEAFSISNYINGNENKVEALCAIAQEQIPKKEAEAGRRFLSEAESLTQQIEGKHERARALAAIGQVYARTKKYEISKRIFEQALECKDSEEGDLTVMKISRALAKSGFYDEALAIIESIRGEYEQEHTQEEIKQIFVKSQIEKKLFSLALIAADKIKYNGTAMKVLCQIAMALRKAGNNDKARTVLSMGLQVARTKDGPSKKDYEMNDNEYGYAQSLLLQSPSFHYKIQLAIASVYIFAGEIEKARIILDIVAKAQQNDRLADIETLIAIGKVQAVANLTEQASESFEKALCIARKRKEPDRRLDDIAKVAQAQAEAKQYKAATNSCAEAIDNLQGTREDMFCKSTLESLAKAQSMAGDSGGAMETLQRIREYCRQDHSFESNVRLRPLQKLTYIESVLKPTTYEVSKEYSTLGYGKFARIIKIVRGECFSSYERANALLSLAKAFVGVGETELARKTLMSAADEVESDSSDTIIDISEALVEVGDNHNALMKLALLKEKVEHKKDGVNTELLARIGYVQARAKAYDAAQKTIAEAIETVKMCHEERLPTLLAKIGLAQATVGDHNGADNTFTSAIQVAEKDTSMFGRTNGLSKVAKAQVKAGLFEEALRTADAIRTYRNSELPEIAACFVKAGTKEFFKRLLIPCSYYRDSARKICSLLLKVYPEKAASISAILDGGD